MKIKFTLMMKSVTLTDGSRIDLFEMAWEEDTTPEKALDMSEKWIAGSNFNNLLLVKKMIGVRSIGESSLTFEPVE